MVSRGDRNGVAFAGRNYAQVDGVPAAVFLKVGDVFVGSVVMSVWPQILMQLVVRFCRRESGKGGEGFRAAAFGDAIVHHGDGGRQYLEQGRVIARIQPVMGDLVNVHRRADDVPGADQQWLDVPCKVSGVEETEIAEFKERHNAVGVVGSILRMGLGKRVADAFRRRAERSLQGRMAGNRLNGGQFLFCRQASQSNRGGAGHVFKRNPLSGNKDFSLADFHLSVGLDEQTKPSVVGAIVGIFRRNTVIVKNRNRHSLRQLRRPAKVVQVEVRRD